MSVFKNPNITLAALFTDYAETPTLTVEQEIDAVEQAQAGDSEAFLVLAFAYGPLLRSLVKKAAKTLDEEEAQATALEALTKTIATHTDQTEDGYDGRLGGRLAPALKDALGKAQGEDSAYVAPIPKRTYVRYLGILNAADGDLGAARDLAPSMGMKVATFDAVRAARETSSLTPTNDEGEETAVEGTPIVETYATAYDEVEDRVLIDLAFSAVTDEEARIIELGYGFTGTADYAQGEPVPDLAIAEVVGLTRPTVQRRRNSGLVKMREALGVTVTD